METITNRAELKNAVRLLEIEQGIKGRELKEQFQKAYDSLKPVSIFKSITKDVVSSPNLIGNILATTISLTTGFYTNKIIVGTSAGIMRKLLGSVVQSGVTAFIARHPEALTSAGKFISQLITSRKKRDPLTMQT
ncbi:MAG: hypothetical protein HC905_01785 [Bacteroidales bacterium]|nr:hypothetical protein [Bacteroidales bacterium]